METVLFVIHLLVVFALITLVLLQRSEGGALGIGGGGGGGMMSSRATGDILTKVTTALAICFFLTSIAIAVLAQSQDDPASIIDQIQTTNGENTGGNGVLDALGGSIETGSDSQTNAPDSDPQVPTGN